MGAAKKRINTDIHGIREMVAYVSLPVSEGSTYRFYSSSKTNGATRIGRFEVVKVYDMKKTAFNKTWVLCRLKNVDSFMGEEVG